MDLSRFKTNDWLVIGGGVLMLIAGFLTWFSGKTAGELAEAGQNASGSKNAFDFLLTGVLPWLLLVGAAVLTFLVVGKLVQLSVPPMIVLALVAVATILILIRIIAGAGLSDIEEAAVDAGVLEVSRGIGLWVALLAGIISTAGAFLGFQAAGGNIRDFADPDKVKGAARRTGR